MRASRYIWLRFGTLAILAAAALSCKSGALDTFDITRSASTTVKGSPLGGLLGVVPFTGLTDLNFSQSSEFANAGVKPNQVDSVKLKRLSIDVTAPANGDLKFLSKLQFFAESVSQPKILLATGGPFTSGQKPLS